MQIQRENLLNKFSEFSYSGNGIVVGSPGIGKTYIIKRFATRLSEQRLPFLYLPVDKLGVENESDLKKEIGINIDIIEYLRSKNKDKPESTGLLLIDAFDAARSEKTQRVFMNLIRRATKNLDGFWNVIVSVRTYDAKKSEELLDLFPDSNKKSATEEIHCRHFVVPKLTDDEILEALETISYPADSFETFSTDFKELLRSPFNLWILEKLFERNQNISELSSISSEVQLLGLFWKQNVTDGNIGENRQMLLTRVAQKMVEERSLSVRKADFYPVDISWNLLLSSEVLVNASTTGQRVAFAHNILFDYAVSVLLMEDSPNRFSEFIEEDPSRPLFLRPSLIYYFTRIWYSNPKLFWKAFWYIFPNENIHLRLFARFLPTAVIANEARELEQLIPLVDSVINEKHYSNKAILCLLQALRTLNIQKDQLWVQFLDKIVDHLDKEFAWDLAILTSEILSRTEKEEKNVVFQLCGNISRCLLQWVWKERESNPNQGIDALGGNWATPLVAETFGTNPQESRKLLKKVLDLINEDNFLINYIFRLIDSLECITPYDPNFTAEIYLTVLSHEENSEEPTYFGTPVVPLSSTRSQDFEMCHHQLIEHFPNFLESKPLLAVETVIKCLNCFIIGKHVLPYYKEVKLEEISKKFQFKGKSAYYIPDCSHIWWDNGGSRRGEPTKMAETLFEFIYEKSLSQTNYSELETIIDLLRDNARVAFFWKSLLKTATRNPTIFAPLIFDLCVARPVQVDDDTTYEFGEFLQTAATEFKARQLQQIEESILNIPNDEKDGSYRKYLEEDRNRLLTRIPHELIKTEDGKKIIDYIKKSNEIPENKPLCEFKPYSRKRSEDDWFEEQGVDLSNTSNEKIINCFPKLNDFISEWQNKNPKKEDIEPVYFDIKQLSTLLEEISDAHEEVLNSAWTKLASCAKIMAKNTKNSEIIFDFCREILLTCSKNTHPEPNPTYDSEFNHPCWSPYPRTEAAQGLPRLAAVKRDEEILKAIKDLTNDKVPSVRFLIGRELFRICDNAPDEFWKLTENIVENENNQLVLQSMCYSLYKVVKAEENKTIDVLEKLLNRINLADQDSNLLEKTVPLIIWLALVRENKWAIETYCGLIKEPIENSVPLKRATFDMVTSYITPQTFDSADSSEISQKSINYLLKTVDSVKRGMRELINVSEKDESTQSKLKDMYEIIDEIVIRLYFAVDTSNNKRNKKEKSLSDKQKEIFYINIKPLLDHVLINTSEKENIMMASTAHYFMQLLNCVLRYDPKGVLKLATKIAMSSEDANYNLDRIAIKDVVELVETILADHRFEIRNEDSTKDLLELLNIFAKSGSPEALKLIWKLDDIFR